MGKPATARRRGAFVDYLLREHEALKTHRQKSLQQRIGHIETAALESIKVTLSATLVLLGMGMYFAYCLTGKTSKKEASSADSHRAMLGIRWHFPTWWKGLGVPK
jgi:hypothetical protein